MAKKPNRQPTKVQISTTASSSSRTPSFNPDYSYVTKDLRRIGILAGSFVGILVILSFFLR